MTLTEPRFLLCAVSVAAVSAILLAARCRCPGALAAWIVYLIMLAPSSGLFRTGGPYIAADRYSFMPMMGLAVLAASALCAVVERGRARRAVVLGVFLAGAGIGLALVARTRDQCRTWHDSKTLWSHAMAVSTEPNPSAYHGLALVLAGEPASLAQAESLLEEALRIVPDDHSLHNAMTVVLAKRGRTVEALAHARKALALAPDNVRARVNLGNLLALEGDPDGARAAYQTALRIDPNDADAHGNFGLLLTGQGRTAEAQAHLIEALRLNPESFQARRTLDDLRRRRDRTGGSPDPDRADGR
jgi:Flp pilus assembly protein TadD